MLRVEMKHVRRKDFDADKRVVHIRASKNETSKRVIPLNEPAFEAVERMLKARRCPRAYGPGSLSMVRQPASQT